MQSRAYLLLRDGGSAPRGEEISALCLPVSGIGIEGSGTLAPRKGPRLILYRTRRWSQVLFNFYRSRVVRRIALGGVFTAIYASAITHMTQTGGIPLVPLKPTVFPLVSILLSLLLAFRTNTAYDRWWEGRKLWGSLVNHCRNLALFLHSTLAPTEVAPRRALAAEISAYVLSLEGHLRAGVDWEQLQELPEDFQAELKNRDHVPNAIANRLIQRVYSLRREGKVCDFELRNLKDHLAALTDVLGGCERIKGTPIPFSYNTYVKHLLFWFLVLLPFGLQADYGILAIPLSTIAFVALAGLEMLAADIEDPFGSDDNDLPTGQMAQTIRRNVFEILTSNIPDNSRSTPHDPQAIRIEH